MQNCKSPHDFNALRKYFSGSKIIDLLEQAIVFVASEFPEELDSRRDRFAKILCAGNSQPNTTSYLHSDHHDHVKEPMANKVRDEKVLCLYGSGHSLKLAVTATVSTDTTAELLNYAHRYAFLPDKTIAAIGLPEVSKGTRLVTVGSKLYCIGGGSNGFEPCNEVKKFETNQNYEFESCDNMIQPRAFPAVVSLDKKIFVFGGLSLDQIQSTPWAEFLDTDKPKQEQKWKALEEPKFRPCRLYGCTELFAVPYDAQTILIGCGHDIENAILYNVADGSWSEYNFPNDIRLWNHNMNPITVVSEKTMYWIHGTCLIAYELSTHIYYFANMTNFGFHEAMFQYEYRPILVHLKDNLFGVLRVFFNDLKKCRVVECTKVQVSKGNQGNLELKVVGYQSYRCDPLYRLCGAVSI